MLRALTRRCAEPAHDHCLWVCEHVSDGCSAAGYWWASIIPLHGRARVTLPRPVSAGKTSAGASHAQSQLVCRSREMSTGMRELHGAASMVVSILGKPAH